MLLAILHSIRIHMPSVIFEIFAAGPKLTYESCSAKKSLNVDSPSFTPAGLQPVGKKPVLSTQAAAFTPRGLACGLGLAPKMQ